MDKTFKLQADARDFSPVDKLYSGRIEMDTTMDTMYINDPGLRLH
ncbi:hypothetical protein [Paenibacillus sp. QZ-Y1]